jgi:hypothetical protein
MPSQVRCAFGALALLVMLASPASVTVAATASAAQVAATRHVSLRATFPRTVTTAEALTVEVSVKAAVRPFLTIVIQQRTGGTWRQVGRVTRRNASANALGLGGFDTPQLATLRVILRRGAHVIARTKAHRVRVTAAPPRRQLRFDLTLPNGWHYRGVLPFPMQTLRLVKDLASSPPGQARLQTVVQGETISSTTFYDDNPGRPNGPQLTVTPGYFEYSLVGIGFVNGMTGPCEPVDNSFYLFEPFDTGLRCNVVDGQPGLGETTNDQAEAGVDALVAAVPNQAPVYVVNLDPISRACNVFVRPDRTVERAQTYSGGCGQLELAVEGS